MSRVTSCRLPRVFKLPFARLSLSLSLFSLVLRPSSSTYRNVSTYVPSQRRPVTPPFTRTRFVSSPSCERYLLPTRLKRGAKYIVDIQQPPITRHSSPPPPRLNVILYDLFDFVSRGALGDKSSVLFFTLFSGGHANAIRIIKLVHCGSKFLGFTLCKIISFFLNYRNCSIILQYKDNNIIVWEDRSRMLILE